MTIHSPHRKKCRSSRVGIASPSIRRLIVMGLTAILLVGCRHLPYRQKHMDRQDQAGSTYVAVLSVMPWEEYKTKLQPKFDMTAAEALKKAIPTTMRIEEKVLDMLAVKAKVATPQSMTSSTKTITRQTDQPITVNEQIQRQYKPGDLSQVPQGTSFSGKSAEALPPTGDAPILKGEPEVDTILQHLVATAIYQEVQLLSSYVKNAATRKGYTGHIVRLQVTQMPSARNLPYDAYTTLSFFAGNVQSTEPTPAAGIRVLPPQESSPPQDVEPAESTPTDGINISSPQDDEVNPAQNPVPNSREISPPQGIEIIPLLVTDNLEGALAARSLERIQELAFGFMAVIEGFGVSGQIDRFIDNLQAVVGQDLNSVFTVGRLSDNTLRIRLGAARSGPNQYAMIPRTHNVTLLILTDDKKVLTDNGTAEIQMIGKTTFVDAVKGRPLPARSRSIGRRMARNMLKDHGFSAVSKTQLEELLNYTQLNNYARYESTLKSINNNAFYPFSRTLWTDLLSVREGSQYTTATVELRKPSPPSLEEQTPLLVDDTKTATTVDLYGGQNLNMVQLLAAVTVSVNDGHYPFLARHIEVGNDGRTVRLTFPSLAALGLGEYAKKPGGVGLYIREDPKPDTDPFVKPFADCK